MWISLIGFTSTGKSTIGKLFASYASLNFLDLDTVLEEMAFTETNKKRSCREIFAMEGRESFTKRELAALNHLKNESSIVLATGGATPLDSKAARLISEQGTVVYLTATPETIFSRMQEKGLPVYLQNDPTIENMKRHFAQRDPVYRSLADIILNTEGLTPDVIAKDLLEAVDLLKSEKLEN
jgi:shikimate kinase